MSSTFKFYRPTPYTPETKEQIWTTITTDAHDEFCGCTEPVFHLLSILIPEDHRDRHKTVDELIKEHYKRQICLFGGREDAAGGETTTTEKEEHTDQNIKEEEDPYTDIDVEELLAAAAADDTR